MKQSSLFLLVIALGFAGSFTACNNQPAPAGAGADSTATAKIKGEDVTYKDDTTTLNGFVAYDESSDKKRPGILIAPEWWGMTEYPKSRAKQLAALGYIAITIDYYGNGKIADNPKDAQANAMLFYKDPQLAKSRLEAALAKLKTYPQLDTANIAAIGYCFGGAMVLNTAKLGEPLKGVVVFHGNLVGVPADKNKLTAKVLACIGDSDKFVLPAEVALFKKQMDSIGAGYTFKSYPGAMHAFSNPAATAAGEKFHIPVAYNAAADTASWNDMKEFFGQIFK